jgi:hypothetical chaperone protein
MSLVELEPGHTTMPTAVFYLTDGARANPNGPARAFGRQALLAYLDGLDGRLMRSMKSVLGSPLANQVTDVGGGFGVKYVDIVAGYLSHLKTQAEAHAQASITQVMLGRPVFFVDDDPVRDAQAAATLRQAAQQAGFHEVQFQYEPIAAAFDFERGVSQEQIVLVADIGGGTSDFSVVRVGPERARQPDRRADILANHGVHVAGTNFDRSVELACVLPEYGLGALGPSVAGAPGRVVPSGVYFDLATWHLINTTYTPSRVAELRRMRSYYASPVHHDRLMRVLDDRLGHELAGGAEQAKIDVAQGQATRIDLGHTERGLGVDFSPQAAQQALSPDIECIVSTALEAAQQAGCSPAQIDALYFTGGSTGFGLLTQQLAAAFPQARAVHGDRLASVATGLGLFAQRWFAPPVKAG